MKLKKPNQICKHWHCEKSFKIPLGTIHIYLRNTNKVKNIWKFDAYWTNDIGSDNTLYLNESIPMNSISWEEDMNENLPYAYQYCIGLVKDYFYDHKEFNRWNKSIELLEEMAME